VAAAHQEDGDEKGKGKREKGKGNKKLISRSGIPARQRKARRFSSKGDARVR